MMKSVKKALLSLRKKLVRFYWTHRVRSRASASGVDLRVNSKSIVTSKTVLGNNVNFNGMQVAGGGKVIIGSNFHSGPECLMISQNHNFNSGEAIPYDSTYIFKDIIIKDNVWLGSRVIVLGGVTVGEGAIIQAGSCVVSDIPDYAVAGGHPAKVFSYRDIDHYKKLKAAGKFH
ncbi:acyltransferase [Idiomarina loihiensis]|uniref:Acetyltransferase, isoleucine patch superfamily n=1 Tax=Idiomarina loihiensis (strain ATCC BAA-735 / DSM 15497 / L2-TR) TaxID=283942 RepID=Q5QWT9_IDILO|nr:acyltransferase [Idiomarina loihiensis]AAV81388.1 Acetyltransferase, isoleucine patch superfamily [Idiomarina loihiensis L2TR]